MPEYALILLLFLIITVGFHRYYRIRLYRSFVQMWVTNGVVIVLLTIWDHFAAWRGHWFWGEQFLLGPRIGFLPIEEFGFFIIMFYFALILYRVIEKKLAK
jgi:lycopene cyclase domain-containing protein